jgi:hypothetical protein
MKVTIHDGMIDLSEIPTYPPINWDPILDELKAEPIPGLYQQGKRMGVSIVDGRIRAYIYLTDKTPPESEILAIIKRHGIPVTLARYFGVLCPNGHFVLFGGYPIEHPAAPYGTDRRVDHPTEHKCKTCGAVFVYEQTDVAHSNWPDGRDAKYPHRD